MPIATLRFKLPEEAEEFNIAHKAGHLNYVIEEFANYLRNRLKYDELTEEQYETYEKVRAKLFELKNEE